MMDWLMGLGIPFGYIVSGFLLSRASWRSRHKRGLNDYLNRDDSHILAFLMFMAWPVLAPVYWGTLTVQKVFKADDLGEVFSKLYNYKLPMSNAERELQQRQKEWDLRRKIHDLEVENGITPTEDRKQLGLRPGSSAYHDYY